MKRNNTIGIVGEVAAPPELIVDAADWARKVYETKLRRTCPSGTDDIFILQFNGQAAGTEEILEKIKEGVEVMLGGEIRSENVCNPKPGESRVKVFIYAEAIAVNSPPVEDQNEAWICGHICKSTRFRQVRGRFVKGKKVEVASIIVAVNSHSGANYIPCVCFGWMALRARQLKVGDYVEVCGRFQSREYKKKIEGKQAPYLCMAYEVCALKLESGNGEDAETKQEMGGECISGDSTE